MLQEPGEELERLEEHLAFAGLPVGATKPQAHLTASLAVAQAAQRHGPVGQILGDVLHAFAVAGAEVHPRVDAEARVRPGEHELHVGLVEQVARHQQGQDLATKRLLDLRQLARATDAERDEAALGVEGTLGDEQVEMRASATTPWLLLAAVLPGVGLLCALFGLLGGSRRPTLLQRGRLAWGRRTDKRETNVEVDERPVFDYTFAFDDEHGAEQRLRIRTQQTFKVEDEEQEPLLYLPSKPSRGQLVDNLPAGACFDHNGRVRPGSVKSAWLSLIPLAVALLFTWALVAGRGQGRC